MTIDLDKDTVITEVSKGPGPYWNGPLNFSFESAVSQFNDNFMRIGVWAKGSVLSDAEVGYVPIDFFSLATGCTDNTLPVWKLKKSGATVTKKNLSFRSIVTVETLAEFHMTEVKCARLKRSTIPNVFFGDWKNDVHLEYKIIGEDRTLKTGGFKGNSSEVSSTCFNSTNPSWLSLKPLSYRGQLKEILSLSIEIHAYDSSKNGEMPRYLGTCIIPIKDYFSLKESEVYVKKDFIYDGAPFGDIEFNLCLKNIPQISQMEGGARVGDTIRNARPLTSDIPTPPKKLMRLILAEPVYPTPKVGKKELIFSAPVNTDEKKLIEKMRKLKESTTSSNLRKSLQTMRNEAKGRPMFAKCFKKMGILEIILDGLNSSRDIRLISLKLLCDVILQPENIEFIHNHGATAILLKVLKSMLGDNAAQYPIRILLPLSIRDTNIQRMFFDEAAIPLLLEVLRETDSKQVMLNIVKIMGYLCYGSRQGEKENYIKVIKNASGLEALTSACLKTKLGNFEDVFRTLNILLRNDSQYANDIVICLETAIRNRIDDKDDVLCLLELYKRLSISNVGMKPFGSFIAENLESVHSKIFAFESSDIINYLIDFSEKYFDSKIVAALISKESFYKSNSASVANIIEKQNHGTLFSLKDTHVITDIFRYIQTIEDENVFHNSLRILTALLSDRRVLTTFNGLISPSLLSLLVDKVKTTSLYVCFAIIRVINELSNDRDLCYAFIKTDLIDTLCIKLKQVVRAKNIIIILKYFSTVIKYGNWTTKIKLASQIGDSLVNLCHNNRIDICTEALNVLCSLMFPIKEETKEYLVKIVTKEYFSFIQNLVYVSLSEKTYDVIPLLRVLIELLAKLTELEGDDTILETEDLIPAITFLFDVTPSDLAESMSLNELYKKTGFKTTLCTTSKYSHDIVQKGFECRTCAITGKFRICLACTNNCHYGHDIVPSEIDLTFQCVCGTSKVCMSKELRTDTTPLTACTKVFLGLEPVFQYAYRCRTCTTTESYVCGSCSKAEHHNHFVQNSGVKKFSCTCYQRPSGCSIDVNGITAKLQAQSNPLVESVQEVIEDDEEEKICIVCFDRPKDTAFYRCGHVACCWECANTLKRTSSKCPVCRKPIEDCMKIFEV